MALRYNNYHKHTHYSNLRTIDSITKPIEYIKRSLELGHTTYFTGEHGFQGNIFEAYTLCRENNMKCIYSVEAYYVDDMNDKTDRTNYHIMLVAMTERARKEINSILSLANSQGFYYKPRIDLNCLLSLTPTDTIVTTACVAGRLFHGDDWEKKFLIPIMQHFGNNLYLEIQDHNEQIQKDWNKGILYLHKKYNLPIIHGCDSHYIHPNDSKYRELFLKAKGIYYGEENGFILDYPDYNTILKRYSKQGIVPLDKVKEALNNTLIFDNAEGITIDKSFKIPTIKKDIIQSELGINDTDENVILKKIISKAWAVENKKVDKNRIEEYKTAIYDEVNTVAQCGMARYFILNNIIVKRAKEKYNAVMSRSGRGSAVSFYINKLLGFTEIDRLTAPITLYPSRFMSAERILKSHSLPDIDMNWANVNPVIQASKDVLGDDGVYYMVAYKPLQESSAFRLWCKANDYNINDYDDIAKNIDNFIDSEKWGKVIEESKIFRGVIESVAPSPCSFLLLDKPISEEIGLIRVGDSNKYTMCCCLDGYNCDVYKYLKNDLLTVTVYDIIDKVYKLIGRPIDDINTLIANSDKEVWDIYANGITTSINQADSDYDKQILKRYKPQNIAELSAYVAAIRPGFSSLLENFINRLNYTTGVKELDDLLEDSFHYLMYQESLMKYFVWLGIDEKETYDIIKKIAKKKFKEKELEELKSKLLDGWQNKIGNNEGFEKTWQVVQDAGHYAFNASHSYSVAIDSLYGAYLKSKYPLEYFTVALNTYADDKERTANLISELSYFNIVLKPIKFGRSASEYSFNKEERTIYKGINSVKYCNTNIAEELEKLYNNKYSTIIELFDDIKDKTSLNTRQISILIKLNYFSDFGKNKYLQSIFDIYNGIKEKSKTILPAFRTCNQIKKDKIEEYSIYGITEYVIQKYSSKETLKAYSNIDNIGLLNEIAEGIPDVSFTIQEQVQFEMEYLQYVSCKSQNISAKDYYIVIDYKTYQDAAKPYVNLYNLKTGKETKTKIKQSKLYKEQPFGLFSILKIEDFTYEYKKRKQVVDGELKIITTDELEPILENYEVIKE